MSERKHKDIIFENEMKYYFQKEKRKNIKYLTNANYRWGYFKNFPIINVTIVNILTKKLN